MNQLKALIVEEIQEFEKAIQDSLQNPNIHLIVNFLKGDVFDRRGKLITEWDFYDTLTPEREKIMDQIDTAVKEELRNFPNVFPINTHFEMKDNIWNVLIDVVGTQVMSSNDLTEIEKAVSETTNQVIKISILFKAEIVITENGYVPFKKLTDKKMVERIKILQGLYDKY